MVRNISWKTSITTISHLKTTNTLITDIKDISNTLTSTFVYNLSSQQYTLKFQKHKQQKENQPLNFKSKNLETYNTQFSLRELMDSLHSSHDTATGPDDIHYQLLKHLPDSSLTVLLNIFNSIWTWGSFSAAWRQAVVVPIPKPEKDRSDPNNYCPIALTSCLCKTMERMVNNRLVYYLEFRDMGERGTGQQRTCGCHFLWPWKGLWHHLEVWHHTFSRRVCGAILPTSFLIS